MTKSFNEYFKETILKNKRLVVAAIIVTVLAFGFTITNFSIGVDDPAAYHYLHTNGSGNMIQQGRLSHVLFDKLTGGRLTFIPFLNDFVGAALFGFSALVFCGLFQYVTDGKLDDVELISFAGIYISYSIISEKFIYNLDVIVTMLSYVCVAYSLALICEYFKFKKQGERGIKRLVLACFAEIIALGSYESFAVVYICGVFAIFVMECVAGDRKLSFKDVLLRGLMFLLVLVVALVVYYSAVRVVQILDGQSNIQSKGAAFFSSSFEKDGGLFTRIKESVSQYIYSIDLTYLPVKEFIAFSGIGLILIAGYSVKRKSWLLPLCYLGLWASNFGIYFAVGTIMYRANQTYCLFAALVAVLIAFSFRKMKIKPVIISALAGLLIFVQLADLNLSFYNDYSRYKKEEYVIHTIATRLVAECDVGKPVVFCVKGGGCGYLANPAGSHRVNGSTVIGWGCTAFYDDTTPMMIDLFRMHGYGFINQATPEQAELGNKLAEDMECWPNKDCIKEFDDFIVVNF